MRCRSPRILRGRAPARKLRTAFNVRKTPTCRVCATCCAGSHPRLEPRAIDIDETPRRRPEAVFLVALDPRLRQRVLDAVDAAAHRRVRGNDLGHACIQLVALGIRFRLAALAKEVV